jgi:hypothetical protein
MEESWDGNLFELMDASMRFFASAHSACIDNKKLDRYNFF